MFPTTCSAPVAARLPEMLGLMRHQQQRPLDALVQP
jgi:hypothetical protein